MNALSDWFWRKFPGLEQWTYQHDVARPLVTVSVLLAIAVGLVLVLIRGEPTSSPPSTRKGSPGTSEIRVNDRGGYAFRVPPNWQVSMRGPTSEVVSPTGNSTVTLGASAPGSLRASANKIVSALLETNDPGHVTGRDDRTLAGLRALQVGGVGTTPSGLRVRFLGISLKGGGRTFTVTVLVPAHSNGRVLFPPIARIIRSLEQVAPPTPVAR